MIIKVCGMRDADNIREVVAAGADWIGFIFYPQSSRYVSMVPTHAGIIPDKAENQSDTNIVKVGVFVDDMPQNIITRVVNYQLDVIQLHGHETPTMIRNLRNTLSPDIRKDIKMMKAISLADDGDIRKSVAQYQAYADCVDYFLFDTQCASVGGSGRHFDWSQLSVYDGDKPFLLSGGIGPDDIDQIRSFHHPMLMGIDINSRFETAPALKDAASIRHFIASLNS